MNIILFITIIVLFLIFIYQLILFRQYKKNENFKSMLNDQSRSFLSDKSYYDVRSDSNFIDINKKIKLNPIEYQNLCNRVDIYNTIKEERLSEKSKKIKKNLIKKDEKYEKNMYPLVRKEVSTLKLDQIILNLINSYKFNPTSFKHKGKINVIDQAFLSNVCVKDTKTKSVIKYENIESYRFIKNWILERISIEAEKPEFAIEYVDNTRFKFKYDKVIDYFIDYKNHLERFVFNGVLFRENKEHNFFIYFDIIFDYKNIKYYINDIIILGVNLEEYILFSELLNKGYDYDNNGVHLSLSKENSGYVTDKYINNYWDTVNDFVSKDIETRKKNNNLTLSKGTCFFKDASDKDNCISYRENEGTGVWDTPCKYNEDCPFYKKNSNYPNTRGGCNNGFCEMPINISTIGYKEYNESNLDKALCHNCKYKNGCLGIECSQCCEDQKDLSLYPDLKSPDYAFPNDYKERIEKREYFEENNLSPYKILV